VGKRATNLTGFGNLSGFFPPNLEKIHFSFGQKWLSLRQQGLHSLVGAGVQPAPPLLFTLP